MRRPEGITVLALYFFAMSIPSLIGALCLLAGAITTGFSVETIDFGIFAGIAALVVVMILAFGLGILFFATALGLWRVRSWSRWLSIVISILSLLAFPIGTIIGAVTLYYLFRPDIKQVFEEAGQPYKPLVEEALGEIKELSEYPEPEYPEEAEIIEETNKPNVSDEPDEQQASVDTDESNDLGEVGGLEK